MLDWDPYDGDVQALGEPNFTHEDTATGMKAAVWLIQDRNVKATVLGVGGDECDTAYVVEGWLSSYECQDMLRNACTPVFGTADQFEEWLMAVGGVRGVGE